METDQNGVMCDEDFVSNKEFDKLYPRVNIDHVFETFKPDINKLFEYKALYLKYKLKIESKLFLHIKKNGVRKTARELNYSAGYLSDIKNGKRNIGEKLLIKFVEQLN